ncbi:MAG: methionyl-tRNA synthetase, partial [Flavobacteriales bacterium]
GEAPELRETENLYVTLGDFDVFLREWLEQGVSQAPVRNFVNGWLDGGLNNWCISRDAPYFGFEIPGEPGKYFYVWLDAPVGYISSTKRWCEANGQDWNDWWSPDADVRLVHNIGKDIVYFHTLFWPAMLKAAGLKTPDDVHVHGMLTVDGAKMSKTRGTFINAAVYLEHLDPEYLRFYYATKLSGGIEDIDLNLGDFVSRVNAELVNNAVNLCSRVMKFIEKRFDGQVAEFDPASEPLCAEIAAGLETVRENYAEWNSRDAIKAAIEISNAVNLYMQDSAPWTLIKESPEEAARVCAVVLHGATAVMTALSPAVPKVCGRYAAALGLDALTWEHAKAEWRPERVTAPETLLERIDADAVDAMVEAQREAFAAMTPVASRDDVVEVEDFSDEITFDQFSAVDLRIGVVESADFVEGANKLLQLRVHCGRSMNVFAGVRSSYPDPSVLVGRRVVVVANLKPRKMRFGISEGMLLATSAEDGEGLQLVHPDDSAIGGWTVR